MECSSKNTFGLFGSLFFSGGVIASLILPRLSDIYGRRMISISGIFLHIIAGAIIVTSSNLNISLAANFCMGLAMAGRIFVGWVWMAEHMRAIDIPFVTSVMFSIDALCIFDAAIWFQYISKDYTYFYVIPLILLTLILLFRLF